MSKEPLYIVIAGKKQHGKDTVAQMIRELIFKDFDDSTTVFTTSFASPLKMFCHNVFNIQHEDMTTEEGKRKPTNIKWEELRREAVDQDGYKDKTGFMTIRELLQFFGSNICRNRFLDRIWAQGPFNIKGYDVVIVPDCRFKNELAEANKNNSIIFKIWREPSPTKEDNHISEKDLDGIVFGHDEMILNWGTIEDLRKQVETRYLNLIKPRLKENNGN